MVCGASNVPDPGGLVCFAPLGATLPAVGTSAATPIAPTANGDLVMS